MIPRKIVSFLLLLALATGMLVYFMTVSRAIRLQSFAYRFMDRASSSTRRRDNTKYPSSLCRSLQAAVQRSFHAMQHPDNCQLAKYLVCDLKNHPVGLGSRIHAVVFCHYLSYSLNRVLILRNGNFGGMATLSSFVGANQSCSPGTKEEVVIPNPILWDEHGRFNNSFVILTYIHHYGDMFGMLPPYLPHSVPTKIAQIVEHLGIDPMIWHVGQSLRFVIGEIKESYRKDLNVMSARLGIQRPLVGLHIRHGDKGNEAKPLPVQAYMPAVEAYFKREHPNVTTRRVYVATDDRNAVRELQMAYPTGYVFISRVNVSAKAGHSQHDGLYDGTLLEGLLTDIITLTNSEFVVCTFSSNIGRLIHSLRHTVFDENSTLPKHNQIVSLDDTWFFYTPAYKMIRRDSRVVIAKTAAPATLSDGIQFIKLEKDKWYMGNITNKWTLNDKDIFPVLGQGGFVEANNVYVYPSRTNLTDPTLELQIERMLLQEQNHRGRIIY